MKKLSFKLFAVVLMGFFTLTACDTNTNAEKAGENMEEAADQMGEALKQEKK